MGYFYLAVNNGHIVEVSLGYFINPFISVLFAVVLFNEVLSRGQLLSLLIAAIGVLVMIVANGGLPIISLSLAITFALYSVMKKKVSVAATHGLAIEMLVTLLPAAAYLMYMESQQVGRFATSPSDSVLLILGGLFTLVPLLLFAAAAKRVTLTVLSMTQYIGPTCQLFIGVFIYDELFGSARLLAFGFIWVALLVYSVDQLRAQQERRRLRNVTPVV